MGKLKDGLTSLSNLMKQIDVQTAEVCGEFQRLSTASSDAAGMVTQGYMALLTYLIEHFKKKGQSIDAHKADTVKDLIDPNVIAFVKGIETQRLLARKLLQQRLDYNNSAVKALLPDLQKAKDSAGTVSSMIAKKKKQWLQSKKFKDKIKGYETQLEAVESTAKALYDDIHISTTAAFPKPGDPVFKDAIVATTTVGEMMGRLSEIRASELNDFKKGIAMGAVRTARIKKNRFGDQAAQFKKWSAEADEMETEGS